MGKHNELRRKVAKGLESRGVGGGQPKAADIYELSWDPVLAASAQRLNLASMLLITYGLKYFDCVVIVAYLAERSLLISKVCSSNPVIGTVLN